MLWTFLIFSLVSERVRMRKRGALLEHKRVSNFVRLHCLNEWIRFHSRQAFNSHANTQHFWTYSMSTMHCTAQNTYCFSYPTIIGSFFVPAVLPYSTALYVQKVQN